MSAHGILGAAEAALGATGELIKKAGGTTSIHPHGPAGKMGQWAVQGAAVVAPIAVAKAGALTIAAGAVAVAAAPAVAVATGVGAATYGLVKLYRWLEG